MCIRKCSINRPTTTNYRAILIVFSKPQKLTSKRNETPAASRPRLEERLIAQGKMSSSHNILS